MAVEKGEKIFRLKNILKTQTEFPLFGAKLYLSPIIDLYNGEIISFNIAHHPTLEQTMDMLKKAFSKIPDNTNLVLHSDQGCQYQHGNYQYLLKKKGIIQSMSRKGNCLDNAVMENFFGHLKSELLYLKEFDSMEHFKKELEEYIYYYNNDRIKLSLKGMSPVKYRTHSNILILIRPTFGALQIGGFSYYRPRVLTSNKWLRIRSYTL